MAKIGRSTTRKSHVSNGSQSKGGVRSGVGAKSIASGGHKVVRSAKMGQFSHVKWSAKHTSIKKIGNGTFLPLHKDVSELLGVEAGSEVEILSITDGRMTVAKVDSAYQRTRRSAEKMGARYARTLALFGQ